MAKDSKRDSTGKEKAGSLKEQDSPKERDKGKRKDEQDQQQHAAYGPDFLRAFAKTTSHSKRKDADPNAPFAVISGAEAHRFARRFVREQAETEAEAKSEAAAAKSDAGVAKSDTGKERLDKPKANARTLPPVVFALPRSAAGDAGRKVVDFYMSWRGKTKTTRLKGVSRRAGFLDKEFSRVRKALDGEWRRASRALTCAGSEYGDLEGAKLVRAPTDPQTPPRLPPLLAEYAREERERDKDKGTGLPPTTRATSDPLPPPSSFPINPDMPARPGLGTHRGSIDSVTSLPLLGMVRGVPAGNRVPLRVTNPGDRMSMSSSSGSIVEVLAAKRGSPLREGVAFYVPDSEATSAQTHTLQLPGRTASDSSGASSSGSSRKSKSGKSKSRKEATPVDEGDQEKILIVLLDEKDRDSKSETKDIPDDDATWHGLERRLSTRSAHKPSPPASAHHSPWMGPLVHLNEDITYIHTPEHSDHGSSSDSDSDSDSDDGAPTGTSTGMGARWSRRDGAVPIKNLLSAMGYLTPEAAVIGGTPSPYGSYAALPAPYNSPYVPGYVSPYPAAPQQGSPYHSPYPQPPSRPQTPVSYFAGGTPPMQTQQVPWASPGPGPGYPPTSYNSPAPGGYASPYASPAAAGYASSAPAGYASPAAAGYASPAAAGYANSAAAGYANSAAAGYANSAAAGYASPAAAGYANSAAAGYASPAAGYASPPAAYYSPAAGYPNLAAGYSSPYVQPLQGAGADRGSFYYS